MSPFKTLVIAAVVIAVTIGTADARKRKAYKGESSESRAQAARTCGGGILITADEQIRGCTALIRKGLSRSDKATAFYNRGNAYIRKTRLAEAVADFDQAITIDRRYSAAIFNRAIAHEMTGDWRAAIIDYNSYLDMVPHDANAFAMRGGVHLARGKVELAAQDFQSALRLSPKHESAMVGSGHAKLREQRYSEALADYDAVLEMNAWNAEALYGRGTAKMRAGQAQEGAADLATAALIDIRVQEKFIALGITATVASMP